MQRTSLVDDFEPVSSLVDAAAAAKDKKGAMNFMLDLGLLSRLRCLIMASEEIRFVSRVC